MVMGMVMVVVELVVCGGDGGVSYRIGGFGGDGECCPLVCVVISGGGGNGRHLW